MSCNLINNIYEICSQYGSSIFLVADENTVKLLNKNIHTHLIIPGNSLPSLEIVKLIQNKAKGAELIVAFGSGTVNDVCKYASYIEKKDYVAFATAASMNGYTSANASILVNGQKTSVKAHLPKAVYIDIDIITNAPLRLTLSGFADFICRSTVQADWLLSHLLFATEYSTLPFEFSRDIELVLLKEYKCFTKQNTEIISLLMEALLISGIGMTMVGSSCPASQGEHMIAHAMEVVTQDYHSLHGEKVAVATITMSQLQEKILSVQNPVFNLPLVLEKEFFGDKKMLKQKQMLQQKAISIISKNWMNISKMIKKNLLPAQRLQKVFADLSIPYLPEHLGWNQKQYSETVKLAFATRDRFTFLDLAILMI